MDLVELSLTEKPGFNPLKMMELKGKALLALGKYSQAREVFEELPKKAAIDYKRILKDEKPETIRANIYNWEELARGYLRKLDAIQKNNNQRGAISGKIFKGGKEFEGAYVYLIDKAVNKDYYTGYTGDLTKVVTGPDGAFSFKNLLPGNYALGVGVRPTDVQGFTMQQVKENIKLESGQVVKRDLNFTPVIKLKSPLAETIEKKKVTFKWEPVDGSTSYSLFIGPVSRDQNGRIYSTHTYVLQSGIKNCQVTIDASNELDIINFNKGIAYDDSGVNPASILGLFSGGEFTWGVYAYDTKGNRITNSTGYGFYQDQNDLPVFKIHQDGLTKGDELLLARKYEAAIDAYQEQLQKNPQDIHSLLVLARLYQYGPKHEASDPTKAAYYYKRLLKIVDLAEVREALADVYYRSGQYDKANIMYSSLLDTPGESWLIHYRKALIEFRQGRPQKSLEMLEQAVNMENGIYVRSFPVVLSILMGKPDKAINFASKVDKDEEYDTYLIEYVNKNYTVRPDVREVILSGEYDLAHEMLTSEQHDMFIKGLLIYAKATPYPRQELEIIMNKMEPGLLLNLMQSLL